MDRDNRHIVLDQLCVFDFVGVLFLQGRPAELRIDDKGRTFIRRIERKGLLLPDFKFRFFLEEVQQDW